MIHLHIISDIIFNIGSTVCHQMSERSICMGGNYLPVCARCTGIYIGFAVSALYLFITKGYKGNKPFNLLQTAFMVLCILPLMIDGVGSYIGLWNSNNLLRIFTGSLCGFVILPFIVLVCNFSVKGNNDIFIFKKIYHTFIIPILCIIIGLIIYFNIFTELYFLYSLLICFGIFIYYFGIFTLIFKLVFSNKNNRFIFTLSILCSIFIIIIVSFIRGW